MGSTMDYIYEWGTGGQIDMDHSQLILAECSGVRQEVRGPLAQIWLQITSGRVDEWTTYDPYNRDAPSGSDK